MGFFGLGFNFDGKQSDLSGNTYLDLTAFTKVDPAGNFTIDINSITVAGIETSWDTAYVYKDYGPGYFQKDFVINFEVIVTDINANDNDFYGLVKVSNALGPAKTAPGPVARLDYDSPTDAKWQFYAGDDNYATSFRLMTKLGVGVYYCTLERISNTPGMDDGQVTLSVYSDSNRTVILGGGSIPRIDIPKEDMVTLRYLILAQTYRDSVDHTPIGSYKIQNVKIISNG